MARPARSRTDRRLTMATAFQQGLAAARSRDLAQAETCFRRAVAEDPADMVARAWLGQARCAAGAVRSGVADLLAAGTGLVAALPDPRAAAALDQVIAQLRQWAALPEAARLLDALVARDPDDPAPRLARAATYAMLNRPDEALADARHAHPRAPATPAAALFLASLESDAGQRDAAEQRLRGILAAAPPPRETFRALKELARLLDRRGAFDAAADCLVRAGTIGPQLADYAALDRTLLPRKLASNRREATPALLGRWRDHAFDDGPAPAFVLGFFRSGTTLTQEVLASHPAVVVSDEIALVTALDQELARRVPGAATTLARLATLDAAGIAALRATYWRLAEGRFGPAIRTGRFVDKFAMNTVDVALIATVFPDAPIVFMVRDPRDVCLSAFQQLMVPTAATVHLLTFDATVDCYAAVTDYWRHVRPMLPTPPLELRYEAAVTDFTGSYTRVLDRIGVGWDARVARFDTQAAGKFISTPSRGQVAQPLYRSAMARWRNYPALIATAGERLNPALADFGYTEQS